MALDLGAFANGHDLGAGAQSHGQEEERMRRARPEQLAEERTVRGTPPEGPSGRRRRAKKKRTPIHVDGFTPAEFDAFAKGIAISWRVARQSPQGVGLYRLRVAEQLRAKGSETNEEDIKFGVVRQALAEVWATRLTPQELGGTVVMPWLDLAPADAVLWLMRAAVAAAERCLTEHS